MLWYFSIIPLIGCINIIFASNDRQVKLISLFYTIIMFLFSIYIFYLFNSNTIIYQFTTSFFGINIAIDGVSIYFILLTTFIFPITVLSNWYNISSSYSVYYICILILEFFLLFIFLVTDIFMFYIFFESILIPLFIIIGIYGSGYIRIRASLYFFIYTLFGSLFMLLSVIYIYLYIGSTDFNLLNLYYIPNNIQIYLFIGFFISIWVKSPIIPFHTWLPFAHSSASLGGSIILAAIVLKLASYASIRILINILPYGSYYFTPFIQILCIITIIYSSLVTIRMIDFKSIVAYSSIGHMSIIILAIFTNTIVGFNGSYIYNIAHGFISPALFIIVGGILYDRFHTRIIFYYKGLAIYMPIFSILFIFAIFSNVSTPLTANWIGEILCLISIFNYNFIIGILSTSAILLSMLYSIWFYNRIVFGNFSFYLLSFNNNNSFDITYREFSIIIPLIINTIIFGIFPYYWLDIISINISNLIYIIL